MIPEELFHPVTSEIQQHEAQNLKDRVEICLYSEIPVIVSRLKQLDRKITIDLNARIEEDRAGSRKQQGEIQRVYQDRKFTQQLQELTERAASLHRAINKTSDGNYQKDENTRKAIAMKAGNIEVNFETLTKRNAQIFASNQAELIYNQFTYLDQVELMLRDPLLTDYQTMSDIPLKPWR